MVPRLLLSMAVVLVFVFSSGVFIAKRSAKPEVREPTGSELVRARCVSCHGMEFTLLFSQKLLDSGGRNKLDDFLLEHHAPDKEAREKILDYILDNALSPR